MRKKLIIGVVILVVIAGAILGYVLIKKGENGQVKYRTDVITKGDIQALVVTSGTVNPINIVDVGSTVSGKISKLYVDFNSQVKTGQIVAELERDLLLAKVDQNQSNYESALASLDRAKTTLDQMQKKYERSLDLFQKNQLSLEEKETAETNYLGAKSDVVTAKARVSQAKSQLDSSNVDLSYATIRSPIDGTVITRSVNVGQTVAASFQAPVLFKVATDLTKMRVECTVDETDIGKVKEGQACRFTVSAFPNETFNGVVTQVRYSPETVQNVVTYTTVVNADNPDMKLRPGMTATVSIVVGEAKGVLKVPNSALRFTPSLPQEALQKIYDAASAAGGQRQGGQPGAKQQGGRQRGEGQRGSGGQAIFQTGGQGGGGEITPEMKAKLQQQMRQRQSGRVWFQDEQGKLKFVMIRTGITDNTYSEITRGELKEGQKIIIGEESPLAKSATTTQQQGPGGRGGMMFIR
jgi:HlyD family secretion protein